MSLPERGVVLSAKWRDRCSKKEHGGADPGESSEKVNDRKVREAERASQHPGHWVGGWVGGFSDESSPSSDNYS